MASTASCPRCGAVIKPGVLACASCGARLGALDEGPTEDVTQHYGRRVDGNTDADLTGVALQVPLPLGPLPQIRGPGKSMAMATGADPITQIEDTLMSPGRTTTDPGMVPAVTPTATPASTPTQSNPPVRDEEADPKTSRMPGNPPVAQPALAEAETALIKGRMLGPVPKAPMIEPATTPSLPVVVPLTVNDDLPPWRNPLVMVVGAMLLLALGLLIGLLIL